jgi:MFS-type transporter involved in bile tolerance (Atg22 family)
MSFKEPALAQKTLFISKSQKGILLLGYWLISECITVISLFAALYLSGEMHFLEWQVGIAFLFIQLVGFPATWLGGRLVKYYSSLKLLGWNICIWGVALILFLSSRGSFLELGIAIFLMGLVYGNTQSYLRSQYSTIIRRNESGFQFGIYSVISEAAVFIGPIVFGYASDALHSQKIPLFLLFGFMALGYFLIWNIMRHVNLLTEQNQ